MQFPIRTTAVALLLAAALMSTGPVATVRHHGLVLDSLAAPGDGQVIVGFAPGFLPALATGQSLAGYSVLARIPQIGVLVLQASDLALARTMLAAVPGVSYVEGNGVLHAQGTPNDPRFAGQYAPPMVGLPAAWSTAGYGSPSVIVAVVDSGISRNHVDFQGTRMLAGRDYVNSDANPNDDCGHGTHVSGIVGANTNNSVGVAGSSQSTILPLKALGSSCSGSLSNVAQAIVDATDQGADIITMSLGSSTNSKTLAAAVAYAWDHGLLLVAAAGNRGADNAVHYPAAYSQVIAVSAVDANRILASYSSRGPQVEIAAPGNNIDSTASNGGYAAMTGTSMAAPFVAGALALALSCAPDATNQEVRSALQTTAQDLGTVGRDNLYGYGLVRADRLVGALCSSEPAVNRPPSAIFTHTESRLTTSVDGRASSDPDGDALSYAWSFGDGAAATTATASHTYATAGAYRLALTVSDGRLSSSTVINITVQTPTAPSSPSDPGAPAAPPASKFSALFAPAKGCNEWWVEVAVTGNAPISSVAASVNGASLRALPKTSWGAWASSFYVAKGSSVVFQATSTSGETAVSAPYSWLGPPPATGTFTVYFTPKTLTNPWWVEVAVQGNQPVASVDVRLDSGAWTSLPKTSWGTWAKSIHMQPGMQVVFRATSSTGATVTSGSYTWQGAP